MLSRTGSASRVVRMRLGVVHTDHRGKHGCAPSSVSTELQHPGRRYGLGCAIGRLISVQFTRPLGIPLPPYARAGRVSAPLLQDRRP